MTLLIIATLAIGSLFSIAKIVGDRLLGSDPDVQRCGNAGQKSKVSEMPHHLKADSVGANASRTLYPKIEDIETSAKIHNLQPHISVLQVDLPISLHDRAHTHAAGLNAIHDWEVSTTDRIQRQKSCKLDRLPSLDVSRKTQDIYAILAWEEATMRRFRQEKMRRLERLALFGGREVVGAEETVGNACS